MSIVKLSKWAELNGYTYRGAFDRFMRGKIDGAFKTNTNRVYVQINEEEIPTAKVAIYARVSSQKQKNDLDSQADRLTNFAINNGYQVELVVKEIASGLNDQRPKLMKLLQDSSITHIIVEHKDRLTRFGFNYINLLSGKQIIVANQAQNQKDDLMQDLISIITSMVARYYGNRKGTRKTEEIIRVLEQ